MPNPFAIPINLDKELGEAIKSLISKSGYGDSTFIIKEFMEKHKEELVEFWTNQGKDGVLIFDAWYRKWSLTTAEQDELKKQKEQEKHEKLVSQYEALGMTPEISEELATAFPETNPLDVVKIRSYNSQSQAIETKKEEKENLEQYRAELGEKKKLKQKLVEEQQKLAKGGTYNDWATRKRINELSAEIDKINKELESAERRRII